MNSKPYKVIGRHKDTNRNRTLTLWAGSVEAAEQSAIEKGLLPPFQVEVTIDPPTEKQLSYAVNLGITIPENATKTDLICLIDRVVNNDPDPNPGLVEFADGKGVLSSAYIGKRSLYNLVFNSINATDKTAFFAFSIYRWVSDDRHANLDTHSNREVFYQFAESVQSDNSFQKSLQNYSGEDLRFFGTITTEDSDTISEYTGGSSGTKAYKMVAEFLKNKFNTPLTRNKSFKTDNASDYRVDTSDNVTNRNVSITSERSNASREYSRGWREFTGGYNKEAMIAVGASILLCVTPLWWLGLLVSIPSLLWLIVDTLVKVFKYKKHLNNNA